MIDPTLFRAYDIRGIVDQSLTESTVELIGRAIGSAILTAGDSTCSIGRDGRLSSPSLSKALCQGILSTGCNVIDIGLVPTPMLYYATYILNTNSGVMLTGSHNPANYNGLKTMIAGKPLTTAAIADLLKKIQNNDFKVGNGNYTYSDITTQYINQITEDTPLTHPLKIVIDAGNGAAAETAPMLFKQMGCEVTELYCTIDGNFPNHHPDPSQPVNLVDLIAKVQETNADIGLAFDGDGDRLGVVTSSGDIIWPDRQMMLFAKSILDDHPGATIIYDVKCSNHLGAQISKYGGTPLMWKTGHSYIKAKIAETGALLAGEMSGHLFFNDRWYGFDDALYAAARLLQIVSCSPTSTTDLFNKLPNSINTPELKIPVADNEKFTIIDKLAKHTNFAQENISTIDGLRMNFPDGWGLVRPSNTTPCLVLRFEADNHSVLENIQTIFRNALLSLNPNLEMPF